VQRVETVTTIGAGDNFNAGILYGLLRDGIFREKARDLGPEDWPALVQTALRFSAEVCRSLFNYVSPDFQA
jgi:fructokinase